MGVSKDCRREIDAHAGSWAMELIDEYGPEADRVMLSCLQHPGYSAGERYCFRQVRQELRQRGIPEAQETSPLAQRVMRLFAALLVGRRAARG